MLAFHSVGKDDPAKVKTYRGQAYRCNYYNKEIYLLEENKLIYKAGSGIKLAFNKKILRSVAELSNLLIVSRNFLPRMTIGKADTARIVITIEK